MKQLFTLIAISLISLTSVAQQYKFEKSVISFKSSAPKEDISAKNEKSIGIIDFGSMNFTFRVSILKFIFPNQLMQEHFNENYMESEVFPYATYKGSIDGKVDITEDGVYNVTTKGKIEIHGVEQEVSIPSVITIKGKNITLSSAFKVKPADYKIKIPGDMSENIAEEMQVTVEGNLIQK